MLLKYQRIILKPIKHARDGHAYTSMAVESSSFSEWEYKYKNILILKVLQSKVDATL